MRLTLNHTQRLNLHALIGAQRGSVDDLRLYWKLQDRIGLDDEEKARIKFKIQDVNGMQQANWDPNPSLMDPCEYVFEQSEFDRLQKIVKEWQPGFVTAFDRIWLEPLLAQLEVASNGHK